MGDAKRNTFETIEGTAFGLNAEDLNERLAGNVKRKKKKKITSLQLLFGNYHGSYQHMTGHVRSHVREVSYVVPYESAVMSAVDIKCRCE